MAIRFYKLFDYMNRHDMKRTDLKELAGLSSSTVAKLAKGESITTETVDRICSALKVQPGDIMEHISE